MARQQTQAQRLLELLRERGSRGLTPLDALEFASSFRLAARIYDSKAAGHDIKTETVKTKNGAHIARYTLREKPPAKPVQLGLFGEENK